MEPGLLSYPDMGVAIAFFTDVSGVRVELTEGLRQY